MASFSLLLKSNGQRELRRGLIYFLEGLSLHLQGGYEFSYSWAETIKMMSHELPIPLRNELTLESSSEGGLNQLLTRLAMSYPTESHRIWFAVLQKLYLSGAGLVDGTLGLAQTLRSEEERDLKHHLKTLPTKINITLILFFLPATFLLLFVPLLINLANNFK